MKTSMQAISVAIVLAMTAVLGACNKQEKVETAKTEQKTPPTVVDVQIVQLQSIPVIQTFSGRVSAVEVSEVRPQASGIVDAVLFKEGSYVKKGQELYQLNRDNYVSAANTSLAAIQTAEASLVSAKASLAAQQATLAQARSDLARVEGLVKIDAISKQLYDQYQTAVKTAQANVEAANATVHQAQASINSAKAAHDASLLEMSRTVVRAPISGKIGISAVTAGALVSASQATPLATISRTDVVFVDISQSSSEMLRLRQQIMSGQASQGTAQVQIVLEDGETYPLIGQLALSDAKVDKATGSVILRAVFPNPDGVLIPGMYVNANLAQTTVNNAVLLPQSAITRTPKGEVQVYVVNQHKQIEVRTVKTAGTYQGQWIISEGLVDGDAVVVMGGAKVKAEQVVEPRVLPPAGMQTAHEDQESEPQPQSNPPAVVGQHSVMAAPNPPSNPSTSSTTSLEQEEAEAMTDSTEQAPKAQAK